MLMYFAFKWKHRNGAMVNFEPDGWSSDDPAKTAWLNIESGLSNPWPIRAPLTKRIIKHVKPWDKIEAAGISPSEGVCLGY
jgi:hypothetical protein